MKFILKILILTLLLISSNKIIAQENNIKDSLITIKSKNIKFKFKQLIIPTTLIAYGFIGIESDGLKDWNLGIREEVIENIDKKITIDDFSQYAPAISVYALNLGGIKGKKQPS